MMPMRCWIPLSRSSSKSPDATPPAAFSSRTQDPENSLSNSATAFPTATPWNHAPGPDDSATGMREEQRVRLDSLRYQKPVAHQAALPCRRSTPPGTDPSSAAVTPYQRQLIRCSGNSGGYSVATVRGALSGEHRWARQPLRRKRPGQRLGVQEGPFKLEVRKTWAR